jgi:uncharacterized protein
MKIIALGLTLLAVNVIHPDQGLSASPKPSFDCRKAESAAEKRICSSTDLSQQEQAMAKLYKRLTLLQKGADLLALKDDQKKWLAERDGCQTDGCITEITSTRVLELQSLGNQPSSSLLSANPSDPNTNLYKNKSYGFEISVPREFRISKAFQGGPNITPNIWSQALTDPSQNWAGKPLVAFIGSDRSELRIGVDRRPKDRRQCTTVGASETKETLGGGAAVARDIKDAAMQKYLDGKHYRIYHAGACIVIERLLSGESCEVLEASAKAECEQRKTIDKEHDLQMANAVSKLRFVAQ